MAAPDMPAVATECIQLSRRQLHARTARMAAYELKIFRGIGV
jgi:hypothetical protein